MPPYASLPPWVYLPTVHPVYASLPSLDNNERYEAQIGLLRTLVIPSVGHSVEGKCQLFPLLAHSGEE